jgi:hypothetical protein
MQRRLEREGGRIALGGARQLVARLDIMWLGGVDGPDARCVVGAAGREVAHVGGKEDAGDVGVMCDEFADGDDRGYFGALDHFPDVDVALGC